VVQEQNELFGNDKKPEITYDELQNMKYLELVIKETMRLYPPVPIVGRLTTEDMEFGSTNSKFLKLYTHVLTVLEGVTIPKYTNIAVFIYGLHRNPEYFPDPETFDPERFAQVDGSLSHAYLPFSAGSRNCIGTFLTCPTYDKGIFVIFRPKIRHVGNEECHFENRQTF
jgi:cytochrome P450 family 4